ncbi:hypothetical protein MKW94_025207 [Papaver nudicaule]|uniref:J domain-containing protein n=1 Tax=Papaver nudicaule TaxID=74823 RepID=A0AA41SMX4_PAPNU|nr:hypothetical protein [Papaver nudicaule]
MFAQTSSLSSVIPNSSPFSFSCDQFSGPKSPTSPSSVRFRQPTITAAACSTYSSETAQSPPHLFMSSSASSSLYEILGIPMGASGNEIKSAYRKLARVCHPDVVAMDRKDNSADTFMKIHAAYSTLSDPEKRADYDRKLFKSSSFNFSSRQASTMASSSGYSRSRNWETDQCW